MRVRLPDGTVVNNVPDGTSKEEFTLKAIENGYLDPSYGEGISRPQNPTPEGDIFSSVRNFASNLMPTQQNVPLQPQGKPQAPGGKSWTQRFNEEIQKITPVDSAGDYWSKTFEGFSGDRLAAGMASSINEAGLGLSQAARLKDDPHAPLGCRSCGAPFRYFSTRLIPARRYAPPRPRALRSRQPASAPAYSSRAFDRGGRGAES